MKQRLRLAITNMTIDDEQKENLFRAIWENFEQFEVVGYHHPSPYGENTFMAMNKVRRFNMQNFMKAYEEGHMDV